MASHALVCPASCGVLIPLHIRLIAASADTTGSERRERMHKCHLVGACARTTAGLTCGRSLARADRPGWGLSAASRSTAAPARCSVGMSSQHIRGRLPARNETVPSTLCPPSVSQEVIRDACSPRHLRDCQGGAPLLLQYVQAYAAVGVDVGMVHFRGEVHLPSTRGSGYSAKSASGQHALGTRGKIGPRKSACDHCALSRMRVMRSHCEQTHLRRFERVIWRKMNLHHEHAAGVRAVARPAEENGNRCLNNCAGVLVTTRAQRRANRWQAGNVTPGARG